MAEKRCNSRKMGIEDERGAGENMFGIYLADSA
jgi:hypothetical protein